jgi:leucyl aminopeptidase (aminopeptidase T)
MTHAAACKAARQKGARVLSMGDFNAEMLARGGMETDFGRLSGVVRQVADCLDQGSQAEIHTRAGTSLTMDISGRRGAAETGLALTPGSFAGPPNVEANVGPLEGTAEGDLVVDGSIPHPLLGVIHEPIHLVVSKGLITRIDGGEQARIFSRLLEEFQDPQVYNIAELGLGLNPGSSITGSMMEDEGAYGTCHIGIGDNTDFGGKVKARTHLDLVMRQADVVIDGQFLEKDGKLQNIKMIDE